MNPHAGIVDHADDQVFMPARALHSLGLRQTFAMLYRFRNIAKLHTHFVALRYAVS